jgi:hypothetical protein
MCWHMMLADEIKGFNTPIPPVRGVHDRAMQSPPSTPPHTAACPSAGFIISSSGGDGTVVTNTHIVADAIAGDGAAGAAILCTLQDGRTFPAQLVNFDWCGFWPPVNLYRPGTSRPWSAVDDFTALFALFTSAAQKRRTTMQAVHLLYSEAAALSDGALCLVLDPTP